MYQDTEKLKQKLLREHKGKKLEDVIGGKELKTKKGVCYHIENQDRISLKVINPEQERKKILSDLKLIYGIGEVTEWILKEEDIKQLRILRSIRSEKVACPLFPLADSGPLS